MRAPEMRRSAHLPSPCFRAHVSCLFHLLCNEAPPLRVLLVHRPSLFAPLIPFAGLAARLAALASLVSIASIAAQRREVDQKLRELPYLRRSPGMEARQHRVGKVQYRRPKGAMAGRPHLIARLLGRIVG